MKKLGRYIEIKNLILACSRAEVDVLLLHLKSLIHLNYAPLGLELILSISNNSNLSEADALAQIKFDTQKENNRSAFFMFVRNIILESLLLEMNIERPGVYNNQFRNKISNSKKLLQAQILMGRGLINEASKLLDEVQTKAEKYEHFDCLHACNYFKTINSAHSAAQRGFSKLKTDLSDAKLLRDNQEKSQDLFLESKIKLELGLEEKWHWLADTLETLNVIQEQTPSAENKYYYLILDAAYMLRTKKFSKARSAVEENLILVKNTPSLHSTEREADLLIHLSEILIHLDLIEETRDTLRQTLLLIKKSSIDYYLVSKRLIFLDFYQNNTDNLHHSIKYHIQSKYTRRLPFAASQTQFFKACLDYVQNRPLLCAKILIEEIRLNQGVSADLLMGQTLFLLMSVTDLDSEHNPFKDLAYVEIQKAIQRLSKVITQKRDRTILQILKRLAINPTEISNNIESIHNIVARLSSEDPQMKWKPFSYEIFPYQNWLNAQSTNKSKSLWN